MKLGEQLLDKPELEKRVCTEPAVWLSSCSIFQHFLFRIGALASD